MRWVENKAVDVVTKKEVDYDIKVYQWYERSIVRKVHGTNSQLYEKSRH